MRYYLQRLFVTVRVAQHKAGAGVNPARRSRAEAAASGGESTWLAYPPGAWRARSRHLRHI